LVSLETIFRKRGVAIAASAIVFPLRAAASSSHFERFARRDGEFPDPEACDQTPRFPAVPAIEGPRSPRIVSTGPSWHCRTRASNGLSWRCRTRTLLHRLSLLGHADTLQRRTGVALTRSTSLD
jgi:hypothetical protein